ncbi:MAG: hypothetical protein HYU37_03870 [Acidobacteria bacterium]|nr:hypothetical protein [Acidobacteriota bacterium]
MTTSDVRADVARADAEAVQAHTTDIVAWDVPSAIVAGERFRITVGIKCSSECTLAGGGYGVYDHAGALLASGTLAAAVWPGTTGLYAAEVELTAPAEEGLYRWTAKATDMDLGRPHAETSGSFGVRVVSRPEHLVTIEAVDGATQTPLAGARVVMHPYRAVTDQRGVAEIRVAKGTYRLFVSQTRYITHGVPLEVTADVSTRVELAIEPIPERN